MFARNKPRWTNFCLVGSLGTSHGEASDIWHFFSCDVKNGHHSKARSIERRNLMHADSFLFISRVAASKNHTFFNHFLCLTLTHYRESSHIFAQCPFLTSRSIFGHIWPCGGLMWTTGENIDKTAFTFSARKKKDSIFLNIFFENEFLKDMEIYQKKTNWRVTGHFKSAFLVLNRGPLLASNYIGPSWSFFTVQLEGSKVTIQNKPSHSVTDGSQGEV